MKAAPVLSALGTYPGMSQLLVHTGQHYDENMSEVFFRQLDLPHPDVNLEVGSGTHAQQTAQVMVRFEQLLAERGADLVLVYGDVNSTLAAALVCAKLGIPFGHVEAGLRSFDRSMPEEINRIVTDRLADLLFTPSPDGDENLLSEGVERERIHLVGNVMIDTLVKLLPRARSRWSAIALAIRVDAGRYGIVTLHRPSNVDDPSGLRLMVEAINEIARDLPLVFPVHPRTQKRIADLRLGFHSNVRTIDPLGYLDFLALEMNAAVAITDSGGVQEETTFLGIPCFTLRENTERPITVTRGTNQLIGRDLTALIEQVKAVSKRDHPPVDPVEFWDGQAATRIARVIVTRFGGAR